MPENQQSLLLHPFEPIVHHTHIISITSKRRRRTGLPFLVLLLAVWGIARAAPDVAVPSGPPPKGRGVPLVLRARRNDGRGLGGIVPSFSLPWETPGGDLVVPYYCPGGPSSCYGEPRREILPVNSETLGDVPSAAFPNWRPQSPEDAAAADIDPAHSIRSSPLPYSPWGKLPKKAPAKDLGTVRIDTSAFASYLKKKHHHHKKEEDEL